MKAPCFALLLFAATPLMGQNQANVFDTVAQPESVDETTQAQDVRFRRDVNERMTVPVTLSGAGPFRFLVDTGADRTVISSAVASRLGLGAGESAQLHTMTGISIVRTATVPRLQFSESDIRIDEAPVLDAEKMGADGILGTDSLRFQRVVFDFDKKLMTLVPAKRRVVPREEGTIVVTGRLRNGRLILTNAVADNQAITVVLDTGSQVSVGNDAMRRRLANSGLLRRSGHIELESVTGDLLSGEYTFVKKVELGEVTLANLAVVFADAHIFHRLGLQDRPALLLGMNALRAFKRVSIDFGNKKLRLMLPEHGSAAPAMMASR